MNSPICLCPTSENTSCGRSGIGDALFAVRPPCRRLAASNIWSRHEKTSAPGSAGSGATMPSAIASKIPGADTKRRAEDSQAAPLTGTQRFFAHHNLNETNSSAPETLPKGQDWINLFTSVERNRQDREALADLDGCPDSGGLRRLLCGGVAWSGAVSLAVQAFLPASRYTNGIDKQDWRTPFRRENVLLRLPLCSSV